MRRPKNKAEGIFFDRMTKKGWVLSKRLPRSTKISLIVEQYIREHEA